MSDWPGEQPEHDHGGQGCPSCAWIIRELEAELVERKQAVRQVVDERDGIQREFLALKARVDKAESALRDANDIAQRATSALSKAEKERDYWMEQKRLEDIAHGETLARAEKAEARIAELEPWASMWWGTKEGRAWATRNAREREAE